MASHRNRDGGSSTSSGFNQYTFFSIYSPFSKEKSKECVIRFPAVSDPKHKNTEWIYDDVFTIMRFLQQLFPEMEQAFTNLMANTDSTTFGSPRSAKQFFDRVNGLVSSVKKMLQGTSNLINRHLKFESDDFANLLKLAYNAAIDDPENLNHETECFSEERYGETEYKTMDKVIEALQLTEQDNFLDLGSGCGQIVLYVAAKIRCKAAVGIEKVYERHKYARHLQRELLNILRWLNADEDLIEHVESCVIERGDFLQDSSRNHIKQSTAIYANNIVYGPKINLELTSIFKELLDDGVRIVCTLSLAGLRERGPSTRNFDDFAYLVDTEKLWAADMSWTSKKIDFTKHVVNRDKYRKVLESIDDPEKLQKLCAEFRRNRPNYREESDTDETVSYLSVTMPHHHFDQFQRLAAMRRSTGAAGGAGFVGLLDNNYNGVSDDADEQHEVNGETARNRRGGGGPMQSSLNTTTGGRRSRGSRRQRRYSDSETVNDSPRRPDSMCTPGAGGIRSRLAHASMDDVMSLFSHLQDVTAASLRVGNDGTRCYDTTPKTAYDMLPEDCRPSVNKWLELSTRAYDMLTNPTAELELNNMRHNLQAQRIALLYEITRLQADSSPKRTFDEITHKTLQKFAQYGVCCSTTPALAEFILSTLTDHIKRFREFNDLTESLERDDATDHIMPEVRELVSSTLSQIDHAKQQLVAQAASAVDTANSGRASSFHQPRGSMSSSQPLSYFSLNLLNTLLFQDGAMQQQQRDGQSSNVLFDPRTHRYHLPLPPVQSLTTSIIGRARSYNVSGATFVNGAGRIPSPPAITPSTRPRSGVVPSFVLVPPPSILQQQQQRNANSNNIANMPISASSTSPLLADVSSMTNDIILCRKKTAEAANRFGLLLGDEESQKENDNRLADGGSSSAPAAQQQQPAFEANVESLFSLTSAIDRAVELNQLPNYELFQPVCVPSRQLHQSRRILTPPDLATTPGNGAPLALLRPIVSRIIDTPSEQQIKTSGHVGRPRINRTNAPDVGGGSGMAGKRRRDSFLLTPSADTAAVVDAGAENDKLVGVEGSPISDADESAVAANSEKLSHDAAVAAARRKRPRKRDSDGESSSVTTKADGSKNMELDTERKGPNKLAAARRQMSQENAAADDKTTADDSNEDDNASLPPIAAKRLRRSAKVSRERGRRGSTAGGGRRGINARLTANDDNDSDYAADEKQLKITSSAEEHGSGSSSSSSSGSNTDSGSGGVDDEDDEDGGGTKAAQRRRGRRAAGAGSRPSAVRRTYRSKRGGGRSRTAAARRAAAAARTARNNNNDDDNDATDGGSDDVESSEQNSDDDGSIVRVTRSAVRGTTKKQTTKGRRGRPKTAEDEADHDESDENDDENESDEAARKPVGRHKRSGKAGGTRGKKARRTARAVSTPTDDDDDEDEQKSLAENADESEGDEHTRKKKPAKKDDSASLRSSASVDLPAVPATAGRRGRGRGGGIRALVNRRRGGGASGGVEVHRSAAAKAHRLKIRAAIRQRREVISREGDQHEMHLSDDATLQLSDDDGEAPAKDGSAASSWHSAADSPDIVATKAGRRGSSSSPRRRGGKTSASPRRRGGGRQQDKSEKQRSMSASPVPRSVSGGTNRRDTDDARSSSNTPLPPRLTPSNIRKQAEVKTDKVNANRRPSTSNSNKAATPLAVAAASASSKKLSSVWKQHGGSFGGGGDGAGSSSNAAAVTTLISSGTILTNRTSKAFLTVSDERLNGSSNGITSPSHGPRLSNMKNKGATVNSAVLSAASSAIAHELYGDGATKQTTTDGNARGTSESATSPHFSDITPVDDDEDDGPAATVAAAGKRRKSGDITIGKQDSSKMNGVLVGANDTLTLSPSLLSFGDSMSDKQKLSSFKKFTNEEAKSNGPVLNGSHAGNDRQQQGAGDAEHDGGGSLMNIVRSEIGDLGDNQHSSAGFPPKISSSKPPTSFPPSSADLQQTDVSVVPTTAAAVATPSTQLTIPTVSHLAPPTLLPSATSFMPPLLSTPSSAKPAAAPLLSPPSNQLGPTISNMPTINSTASSTVEKASSSNSVSAASLLRAANVTNNNNSVPHHATNKPGRPRSNATNNPMPYSSGRPPSQQQHTPQSTPSSHKTGRPKKSRGGGGASVVAADHHHHHHHRQQQQQQLARGVGALNSPPTLSSTSSYTFPGSTAAESDVWTPAGTTVPPPPLSLSSRYTDIPQMSSNSAALQLQSLGGGVPSDGLKSQPLMPPPPSHVLAKCAIPSMPQQPHSWMPQTSSYAAGASQQQHVPVPHAQQPQQTRSSSNNYLAARGSAVAAAAASGPSGRPSYQSAAQSHGASAASPYANNMNAHGMNQQQHAHAGFVLQPPPPTSAAASSFLPPPQSQSQHHHQQHLHQQANMAFSGALHPTPSSSYTTPATVNSNFHVQQQQQHTGMLHQSQQHSQQPQQAHLAAAAQYQNNFNYFIQQQQQQQRSGYQQPSGSAYGQPPPQQQQQQQTRHSHLSSQVASSGQHQQQHYGSANHPFPHFHG